MYNRLFTSLVHSSVWSEDSDTCKVWVTLLALQDRRGFVFASPIGLAKVAGLSLEATQDSLEKFLNPDPNSSDAQRRPELEGRRIEVIDGGWRLLNSDHYNSLADAEDRRDQNRQAAARHRKRASSTVINNKPSEVEVDVEVDSASKVSKREGRFTPPTVEEVLKYSEERGYGWPVYEAEKFMAHHQNAGWRIKGRRYGMRDWRFAIVTWQKNNEKWEAERVAKTAVDANGSAAAEAKRLAENAARAHRALNHWDGPSPCGLDGCPDRSET